MKNILITTLIITVSIGCSTVGRISLEDRDLKFASYIETEKLSNLENIYGFKFSGANPLSNKYLTMRVNENDDYLIELIEMCSNIYSASFVQLDKFSSYKLTTQDAFLVNGLRCRIKAFYPLTKTQHINILKISSELKSES